MAKNNVSKELDLSFLIQQPDIIDIPSRGLPYLSSNPLSKGKVSIRPWVTAEEKLMDKFNSANSYNVLKRLVACAVEEKIDMDEITSGDFFYILYWIRQLTYGDAYTSSIVCPSCGKPVETSIDISKLEVTYLESMPDNIVFTLPVSKIEMKMRFPRLREIISSADHFKSEKTKLTSSLTRELYTFALCTSQMTLPNGSNSILTIEEDFVTMLTKIWPNLPASDSTAIKQELAKYDHGFVETFTTTCPNCEEPIEQAPILSYDFFRPSIEEPKSIS